MSCYAIQCSYFYYSEQEMWCTVSCNPSHPSIGSRTPNLLENL